MKTNKITLVLALILFAPFTFAKGPTSENHDEAINLLRSIGMEKTFNESNDAVIQRLSNGDQATYADLSAFLHKTLDYKKLEPRFAEIYARYFTKTELQEILSFQSSPTGKKSLQLMPKIMAETMAITQDIMKSHQPELEQLMKKSIERLERQRKKK